MPRNRPEYQRAWTAAHPEKISAYWKQLLGRAGDSIDTLTTAIRYLEAFSHDTK